MQYMRKKMDVQALQTMLLGRLISQTRLFKRSDQT